LQQAHAFEGVSNHQSQGHKFCIKKSKDKINPCFSGECGVMWWRMREIEVENAGDLSEVPPKNSKLAEEISAFFLYHFRFFNLYR
jgi:hypothetical protein